MTTLLPLHDLDTFTTTRDALHQVAEHVVAKARYVDDGEIRLSAFAGGFSTPLLTDGKRVRVEGQDLVVDDASGSRRIKLSTVGEAADFVGIEPGFPAQLYPPATAFHPDQLLNIDARAAEVLAGWYGFTADVLARFAAQIANPSPLILWPEHFDQAFFTEDADESQRANYGASPGDDGMPEPYLYVGPWATIAGNAFWNAEQFNGAVLPLADLIAAADPTQFALEFLATGRALLIAR